MKTSDYICRKALPGDSIPDIAKYIHLTDPYIYPTITRNPQDPDWEKLIASAAVQENSIFSLSRISVVLYRGKIIGIACVIPCSSPLSLSGITVAESLRDGFRKADEGYFSPLIRESADLDGYNITNVCIDECHRGFGVGTLLLQHCIEEYGTHTLHLDVIASNSAAIRLYQKFGFEISDAYNGFSGSEQPLPCYRMTRKPTAKNYDNLP